MHTGNYLDTEPLYTVSTVMISLADNANAVSLTTGKLNTKYPSIIKYRGNC